MSDPQTIWTILWNRQEFQVSPKDDETARLSYPFECWANLILASTLG